MNDQTLFPHNWVEVRVVPVSAEPQPDGTLHFYSSDEAIEVAEEDLHYMCYTCKAHPEDEVANELCPGSPITSVMDDL